MSNSPLDQSAFGQIFGQLDALKRQLAQLASPAGIEVVGTAASGRVRIRVRGGHQYEQVQIDPALLVDGDASLLEDLVLVALRDANEKLDAAREQAMNRTLESALTNLGDLDVTALSGLAQHFLTEEPSQADDAPEED